VKGGVPREKLAVWEREGTVDNPGGGVGLDGQERTFPPGKKGACRDGKKKEKRGGADLYSGLGKGDFLGKTSGGGLGIARKGIRPVSAGMQGGGALLPEEKACSAESPQKSLVANESGGEGDFSQGGKERQFP